ncbi:MULTISPECIES: hypothetical protein [Paenarthrobacter]|uniref:Centromere-binding protein ParB C-terminal domain-containing protein n=1 Tax=Paenarthrobacter ureafaciens TaxID=37931 RepID=A0AAX3EQB8_PAEUR|nr:MULTISPECIES: hypothetical protein [Paenarthrobacter]MDO5867094.1 hypothetical protein [Paenarthrobacter sp. SD-2]MDO5878263.1 hypothetical protein [Paenarthrobacter sp. SD-1]UYV95535.1 hypothetical protein NL395_23205 [Paenarthrobacter ureafaciens]UYW00136.1 hypothetical protein NL394_23590 [Paenarthrobacter ureafaciens]
MKRPERKFPERKTGTLQASPEPIHIGGAKNDAPAEPAAVVPAAPKKSEAPAEPARKAVTVQVSLDPLKEARAIVNGRYGYRTFTAFVDAAFQAEIQRAREEFNNGEPFPYDDEEIELRKGRPLGS